ncbi:MAG: hypothetical protein ABI741_12980 [Ferruginibacter sp.]
MNISSKAELEQAIIELEKRKLLHESLLIGQFKATRDSLRPMNLIKEGFHNLTHNTDPGTILKTVAGIGAGVLSKKIFVGGSSSIIKKLLGSAFEVVVAKSTISHADKIKAYGLSIYHNLFKKKNNHQETQS